MKARDEYTDEPPSWFLPWKRDLDGSIISAVCAKCGDELGYRAVVKAEKEPTQEWEIVETYCTVCAGGVNLDKKMKWEILADVNISSEDESDIMIIDTDNSYLIDYHSTSSSA